ncbi:delta-60 repeat domain-containing protein [Dyadobacter jiangsuensis]
MRLLHFSIPANALDTLSACNFSARLYPHFRRMYPMLILPLLLVIAACSSNSDPKPGSGGNGTIDPDPGSGSQNLVDFDPSFQLHEGKSNLSAMLSDGRLVIWGSSKKTTAQLFRVLKDGQHDPGFDIDQDKSWTTRKAYDIAVQPDGKVVLAGEFVVNGKACSIIRLAENGAFDRSFTPFDAAQLTTNSFDLSNLLVQTDGKIVFSLSWTNTSLSLRYNAIYRLQPSGQRENSFFVEGAWIKNQADATKIIGSNEINDIIQLSDGKLLACGGVRFFDKRRYIARINLDGTLDETFDFKELMISKQYQVGDPTRLAEHGGKVLVGGKFSSLKSEDQRDTQYPFLSLMRLNANGSIDESFGKSTIALPPVSMVTRSNGDFIVMTNSTSADKTQISLYNASGAMRGSYSLADATSKLKDIFRQSDNTLLVTGDIVDGTKSYAVGRLILK